eukprot:symbB.v1.2.014067.t1/scaffold1007.1/size144738/12
MFGGLITRTPRVFKSHSREDMEAKHDALTAHTSHDMNRVEKSRKTCYMYLQEFVEHPGFDIFFACVVIANAVFVGLDVENNIKSPTTPRPVSLDVAQYTFTVLFSAELGLRFAGGGVYNMICSEDWMWTILDVVVVATSIWEIAFQLIYVLQGEDVNDTSVTGLSSLKAFRIIRVTRILKTAQLVRIFRFVMALRTVLTLVQSVVHTLKALLWAMLLLLLIVYVFAVLFAQAVHDYKIDAGNPPLSEREESASQIYFASLTETMLTLFMSIAGGVSWEEPVSTLKEISGWWTALYFAYIASRLFVNSEVHARHQDTDMFVYSVVQQALLAEAFTYFAVLNVVTAVFCQSAIESASKDHTTVVQNMLDNKAAHLQKLRELFSKIGDESTGAITFGVFEEKISDQPVRDYFETLGLDVWDPWAFFKLLDTDGGGSVEVEEFFMGCLRFSGQASAMDVGKIIQDQSWLMKNQGRFQSYMEQELVKLREDLASFIATASCAPNVKLLCNMKARPAMARPPKTRAAPASPAPSRRLHFKQPDVNAGSAPSSPVFVNQSGSPIIFYVPPCSSGGELRRLITAGGGKVSEKAGKNVINLMPEGLKHKKLQKLEDAISSSFVVDCMSRKTLLPLSTYRLAGAAAPAQAAGSAASAPSRAPAAKASPAHPAGGQKREKFTREDDAALVEWVRKNPDLKSQGKDIWVRAANAKAVYAEPLPTSIEGEEGRWFAKSHGLWGCSPRPSSGTCSTIQSL